MITELRDDEGVRVEADVKRVHQIDKEAPFGVRD
jgi:hypothetical protein